MFDQRGSLDAWLLAHGRAVRVGLLMVFGGPLEPSFSFGPLCVIEDRCSLLATDLSLHRQLRLALFQEPPSHGQDSSGGEQLSDRADSTVPSDQLDPSPWRKPCCLDLVDQLTASQLKAPFYGLRSCGSGTRSNPGA